MIGEVVAKTAEVVAKAATETAKKTGEVIGKEAVNISKRIDVTGKVTDIGNKGIDITKRISPEKSVVGENIGKELSQKLKNDLLTNGMSPGIIGDCTLENDVIKLKTPCDKYADKVHPESNVKCRKRVIDVNGTKIEAVFPKFDATFTTQLPSELLKATDTKQFNFCRNSLKDAVAKNPELKSKFSQRQLEQINKGINPGGYVWHHNESVGKMELVNTKPHDLTKHVGGRAIWGGGSACR